MFISVQDEYVFSFTFLFLILYPINFLFFFFSFYSKALALNCWVGKELKTNSFILQTDVTVQFKDTAQIYKKDTVAFNS